MATTRLNEDEHKALKAAYNKTYAQSRKEEISSQRKSYYLANADKVKTRNNEHREKNLDEARAREAELRSRPESREKARMVSAAWRAADPNRSRESVKASYRKDPKGINASRREQKQKYYAATKDRRREVARAWVKNNLDKAHHYEASARARRKGNGGSHTYEEWKAKCDLFANLCAYCGEAKRLEKDHKVPLIRGGRDDILNVIPACRSCNARKNRMNSHEYLKIGRVA